MSNLGAASRRLLAAAVAAGMITAMAVMPAGSLTASASSQSHDSVNPLISQLSSGTTPQYHVYSCQRGADPYGRSCYDPAQMRKAYGVDKLINEGYDGSGKTIIILDAFGDPYINSDLSAFDTLYGLPTPNFTVIHPESTTAPAFNVDWAEETTLDVEWSHAMAPGANIVLDEAQSNNDSDLQSALQYAVDHNLGDVISQSFGENDTCLTPATKNAWHNTYAEAISKGMTVFASSGDQGASQQTCDGNSWTQVTSSPASDPLVTAVGGTELTASGYPSNCTDTTLPGCASSSLTPTPGTYQSEIAWNEGPPYGDFQSLLGNTEASGGGFSTVWKEPSYQEGTIHGGKQRAVPDVAYNAAIFHAVLVQLFVGYGGGTYLFGGTSCGSPQWAALAAIADQMAGKDLGFINTALYHVAQSPPKYASDYHDVTSGTNADVEYDSHGNAVTATGFNAGSGWDPVTGLGSPVANLLLPELIKADAPGQGTAAINDSKHG